MLSPRIISRSLPRKSARWLERRIALLIDATLSGLPPFLVRDGGVNSGFMIAHVTAAALALGKQDARASGFRRFAAHVGQPGRSRFDGDVRRAQSSATSPKTRRIFSLSNCSPPLKVSICARRTRPARACNKVMDAVRNDVAHYELDHYFAPDIAAVTRLVQNGTIAKLSPFSFVSEQ